MAKTITATELRKRIREVIQGAQFQGEHIIVTVFNKPAVAIISMHDYNKYLERKEQQIQSGVTVSLMELFPRKMAGCRMPT